jgi:iron(III) transport system permease protein
MPMNWRPATTAWVLGLTGLAIAVAAALTSLVEDLPRGWGLALNTLIVAGFVAAGALVVGTFLAVLLARTNLPGRAPLGLALTALLFIPLYVQVSAWDAGWGQQGWYTQWRADASRPVLSGATAAVWIHTLAALPWVVLIVGAGLRQVDPDLEEAALVDASPWSVLWHVTLPRAGGALVVAALFVALLVAGDMTVTDVYRVRTYAEEIYTQLALTADAGEAVLGAGAQLGIVAALVVAAGALSAVHFATSDRTPWQRTVTFELGKWRWPLALAAGAIVTFALGVPLANLVYKAGFTVDVSSGTPLRTWTWETFWQSTLPRSVLPPQWEFYRAFRSTALVAASVATLTVLIAVPLAWTARRGSWRALPALAVCALGMALPGPLIGLGVIWLLNRPEPVFVWLYDRTIVPPVLAITVRTLPLAILVLWHSFRALGSDQIEVARTDGADTWRLLTHIAVPQVLPALAAVWIGAFALAAGDLAASILVNPPGITTVANEVFLLIHAGVHNEEAGLCLTQVTLFGALALMVFWLMGRMSRRASMDEFF